MLNVGEQLVSSYLRYIRGCDFIQTNLYTKSQGEIDVVGLDLSEKRIYICEVAIHIRGLQYTTKDVKNDTNITRCPDNIQKLTDKFSRAIEYTRKDPNLNQYNHHCMFWSPIVKNKAILHLEEIKENIKEQYKIDIECVINQKFQECLTELRNYAKTRTEEFQCPLMRLMQIEEYVAKLNVARSLVDTQIEDKVEAGYSEFWEPIRKSGLFAGKSVPVRDEHYISKQFRGVEMHLRLNNHQCYVLLAFSGTNKAAKKEHRDEVMKLFRKSEYHYEYREATKAISAVFPVLDKGKKDPEHWSEIREKLVRTGTHIYNKINESDL